MARFVPDINTKRWVVITPTRARRPDDLKKASVPLSSAPVVKSGYNFIPSCPFCFGNEAMTPPEVYRWGKNKPDDKEWLVRVVPNKYPITDIHEVIIHSPDHFKDINNMETEQVVRLLTVYRERYKALSPKGTVMIFNNKGEKSGESLEHPHSQVVVIPKQITLDTLSLEAIGNIIHVYPPFVTYCPDFSQWPYEVWIAKKSCTEESHKDECYFGQVTDEEIKILARALQTSIQKLYKKFPDLSYNYYIYPHACWYLRIIPRMTDRAGFELGTGLSVNVVDPLEAARELTDH